MLFTRTAFLGRRGASAGASYASLSFDGSPAQGLTRDHSGSTSADRTRFTLSFWAKLSEEPSVVSTIIDSTSEDETDGANVFMVGPSDIDMNSFFNDVSIGHESASAIDFNDSNWHHYVTTWDTTQGTSDNRIRFYKNGSAQGDAGSTPGASALFHFFNNNHILSIGGSPIGIPESPIKLAFIDILDGVAADASSFAFNNGGTWTRKPYTGGYGAFGFRIDGSNGFNDASGSGFTFFNRGGTSLDAADLPPYTT